MKAYCENCKENKKSSFRNSGTHEDLCCDTCHYVIASLTERNIEYVDRNKRLLFDDDVIRNNKDEYYRFVDDEINGIYLLGCEGYVHDIDQNILMQFEYVGEFEGNKNFFNCEGEEDVDGQGKTK